MLLSLAKTREKNKILTKKLMHEVCSEFIIKTLDAKETLHSAGSNSNIIIKVFSKYYSQQLLYEVSKPFSRTASGLAGSRDECMQVPDSAARDTKK